MTKTRKDVVAAVQASFPNSDTTTVLGVLDRYGVENYERERERVQLAIIALSEGSEDKLLHFVEAAKLDYRDVLSWLDMGPLSATEGEKLAQAAQQLIKNWGKE